MSALTYLISWRPISARIRGLEAASAMHARFLAINSTSPYGAEKTLQRNCEEVRASIEKFQEEFRGQLPAVANIAIDRFAEDGGRQIRENRDGGARLVQTIIVKLIAFEAELTFCLDSQTELVRSAAELAFMHLQRLIVVDEDYRTKWQKAFERHETQCEKLGALHLLWHGVWAFKTEASGGKTDLVYQEPLQIGSAPLALGMVLTEWKRANGDPTDEYAAAKRQAALYSSGVLAGVELVSYRYLIAVTERQITPPADEVEGGVTYRHINIAVKPEPPSIAARKGQRSSAAADG